MYGALFIPGAVVGLVGNALHPHTAELDAAAAVQAIAWNGAWVAIHVTIIIAILLVVGGFVGFADEMTGTSGEALARLGLAAALLGGAVVTVSLAIDGFSLRALAVASPARMRRCGPRPASPDARTASTSASGAWACGVLRAVVRVLRGSGYRESALPVWFGWLPSSVPPGPCWQHSSGSVPA